MTDRQLAASLIQAGKITPTQVQTALAQRNATVSFAQALVSTGACGMMDIIHFDPAAFGEPSAAPVAAPDENIGLGQDGAPEFETNDVSIEEQGTAPDDPTAGPIVRFCNELLGYAAQIRASDMHLEPRANGLLTRYRVDGQLRTGDWLPGELQLPMISRLKILANLDITENRLPQDGRFRATIGGRIYDFRVSTLPSLYGEKVVVRLLDRSSLVTDLTRLGFSADDRQKFHQMLSRSYGMLLVTGPTGSGKTTTLYAALAATRDETKNIVTVEDPVEYELEGVIQTSVQTEIGLTFAAQLRAILRQDPDVILVGEVRDGETAEISIRAALTGHLVLTTLHTNSALAAVTRLQDMGVPPYLIASSLSGVVAQRLVRLICRHCRRPMSQESREYIDAIAKFRLAPGTPMFEGAGCAECNGTGMRGRMAIIELFSIDNELRGAIMARDDAETLRQIAIRNGMKTLWQDGLEKLKAGLTSPGELSRVLLSAQDEAEIGLQADKAGE